MTTTMTPLDLSARARIFDVRECRRLAEPLELRADADSGHLVLEGYAATFDPYDVYGGPDNGGWVEQLRNDAFDRTLSGRPDVQLLINHEGLPIARTASATQPGNLFLRADSHGLLVRAELDPSDPDVQRIAPKMRSRRGRRPLLDEMSFAFRVRKGGQEWSNDYTTRTISEIDLRKGDVSIVNYGMNPNTAAMLSAEAVDTLASLSRKDFAEIRKLDQEQVVRAMTTLREASKPKKYANVTNFADPGYLDSSGKPAKGGNGVKRYPLNSAARVRNAAARFAQNKGRYSSAQQSAIMGKIRSAAKKFGVKISDGDDKNAFTGYSTSPTIGPDPQRGFASNIAGGALRPTPAFNPNAAPIDPHDFPGYTAQTYDYDRTLGGRPELDPGAGGGIVPSGPDIPAKGGYDPHDGFKGKQTLGYQPTGGLDVDERDDVCPGGGMCPGDTCPDHGDGSAMGVRADDGADDHDDDDHDDRAQGDFGGKKAKPFGSDDDDDDDDDDDEEDEDRGLAELASTLASASKLAATTEYAELRTLLSKARGQLAEARGFPAETGGDVARMLAELRSETGLPGGGTISVAEGLRALRESGFAETMQPAG